MKRVMFGWMFRKNIINRNAFRLFSVLLWSIWVSNFAIAQINTDSLKLEIQKLDLSVHKLDLIDTLIEYLPATESDTILRYKELRTQLSIDIGEYDRAARSSFNLLYYYTSVIERLDLARYHIDKILPYVDSLKSNRNQGNIYAKLAGINYTNNDYQSAISNYNEALNRFGENDSLFIADMYFFIGQSNQTLGNFMLSLENFNRASEIYNTFGDTTYMLFSMMEVATLYSLNGLQEKAIATYNFLDSIYLIQEDYASLNTVNLNISIIYKKQNKYKEEEEKLKLAHSYILKTHPQKKFNSFTYFCKMGELYLKTDRRVLAEEMLDSLELRKDFYQSNDAPRSLYLEFKTSLLLAQGKPREALKLQSTLIDKAKSYGNIESIIEANQKSSKIYEALNDMPNALRYFQKYTQVKDSVYNVVRNNQLVYYQTEFETSQKEKQLVEQEGEIKLLESEKKYNKNLLLLSILGLSLLFFIAYLIRSRKFSKKQQEIQENFSTELIEQQEMERKRVSENLHDSLGQSLLLIKNKVYLNNDLDTQKIVDNAIDEVHKISIALHPLQLEQLGLTKAIESTIKALDDSSDVFFSSSIDNITGMFEAKKELNIYRMFQELLSNVVKHSQAKACKVNVKVKSGYLLVDIEDNGLGFDFTEEYNKINSLGLKTLKGRMKKLNGSIVFDTVKNRGTTVSLKIPI